jgi:hypothetical protein
MLTAVDGYTRKCLAIDSGERLNGEDVVNTLSRICTTRELPWPTYYNENRPHSALAWATAAEFARNCQPGQQLRSPKSRKLLLQNVTESLISDEPQHRSP